ncbi:PAS domain-containing protein [Archangium violaceum]|uniref:sensor histidine kinase n=1 Tax=Archangium violaceum TaxID=83451 RepID=UPI00193AEA54|nr:PAS domain-containing protein [Archangium violaceum]QRK05859.1 PAS domain-containing protein [Archangium violaceum]
MLPLMDLRGCSPPRLDQLLDVVTDGVLALDVQGRPTYVNTSAERLLGRSRNELLGHCLWTELSELKQTELGRACQRALAEGIPETVEEYLGTLGAWLEVRVFPTGQGLLVLLRDVTPLKQVEIEYARLHALVMCAPAVAFVTRGPQHVFELSNPRHRQLHGGREMLGRPAREALPELEGQGLLEVLDRVYVTGAPFVLEQVPLRVEGPDGQREEHFFHLTCQPLRDALGRVDGVAAFAFEVTGSVRACRMAEQRAEEANRTKDEFLATVAHELRTPLTTILGWASILRTNMLSPEKQAHALETVERSARVQAQLVDDLLELSRLVAGKMRLEMQPVSLAPVVEAAMAAVRPAAEARDIRIEPRLEPGVGPVQGDPRRLQQVAGTLLSLAIKFTPEGGQVKLLLRREETHVTLEVAGADGGAPQKQGSQGLGMSIVRYLVELHGGTVQLDGKGRGARVTVRLPSGGT